MKDELKNLIECWKLYNRASKLLTDAMGGTSNEVGEFAEKIVCEYYNAKQSPPSEKGADLRTKEGKYIQVKSRKLDRLKTTKLNVFRSWEFDVLVVVLFSKDGDILKAIEIDKKVAEKLAKPDKHQNGKILTTSSELLNHECAIDITIGLQQLINSCSSTMSK